MKIFEKEIKERIVANGQNKGLKQASEAFMFESTKPKYSYNFSWFGRPIIQYPQDMVAMQELIWDIKPDLIIEIRLQYQIMTREPATQIPFCYERLGPTQVKQVSLISTSEKGIRCVKRNQTLLSKY